VRSGTQLTTNEFMKRTFKKAGQPARSIIIGIIITATSFTATAQPGRIHEGLWKAVVRIESIVDTNGQIIIGSGFLVSKQIAREAQTNMLCFLVVNKHAIGDWNLADGNISHYFESLRIYFYTTNMSPVQVQLKDTNGLLKHLVMPHPEPKVDVVVIPLFDEFVPSAPPPMAMDVSYLMPFTSKHIGLGDQVFALGYPAGITSLNNYYPVAKGGYISSLPGEELRLRLMCQNRTNAVTDTELKGKIYLVDGFIVGGNSGGPVVIPNDLKIWVENGQLKWLGNPIDQTIGVVSQVGPHGLTVVFSSDFILELIEAFDKRVISFDGNRFQLKL